MELLELRRQFERTVAPLEIGGPRPAWARRDVVLPGQFTLDVRDGRDEAFVLRLGAGADVRWRFLVPNAEPARRHLLLVVAPVDAAPRRVVPTQRKEGAAEVQAPRHFLCGRDERHLFVAGLTTRVPTVAAAMASLKPELVLESESAHRVAARSRNQRRNEGFVRQGEWFFLPRLSLVLSPRGLVLRDEPIRRGSGKAHLVEYLYRVAVGERVWVCSRYPEGVDERRYHDLLRNQPVTRAWDWWAMVRTSQAYARGRIRHPDHATIHLPFWHQVVPNAEAVAGSPARQSVAFLD